MTGTTEVGPWAEVLETKISYLATKDELQKEISGLSERVRSLETRAEGLATGKDLADESKSMLKWGVAILTTTSISLSALVFRIFGAST